MKLENYGIRGPALEWFESYLSDREQYVTVNGSNSSCLNVTCGVPQGSVLGPLLFLIFINDLPNSISVLSFYLFADDINIYFEAENLDKLQRIVNNELKKVKQWLDVNKLSLNIDKTNFIIFKFPQHSSLGTVNIKIGNQPVKQFRYVKFLGVLLDENLSWKYRLSELSKKLARTCGMLFKIRHCLPVDVMICLYNSLFPSFLQYGMVAWGLTYKFHIKPIHLLQKRVVRAIAFEHFTSPSTPGADWLVGQLGWGPKGPPQQGFPWAPSVMEEKYFKWVIFDELYDNDKNNQFQSTKNWFKGHVIILSTVITVCQTVENVKRLHVDPSLRDKGAAKFQLALSRFRLVGELMNLQM